MKKLYYTVETMCYSDGRDSGLKIIRLYKVVFNQPKKFAEFKVLNCFKGKEPLPTPLEIQMWLDENGYEDEMFKFIKL